MFALACNCRKEHEHYDNQLRLENKQILGNTARVGFSGVLTNANVPQTGEHLLAASRRSYLSYMNGTYV
jgi:hypothetical protein